MNSRNALFVVPGRGGWAYVGLPGFSGRIYVRASLGEVPRAYEPEMRLPRAAWKVVDLVVDGEGEPIGAPFLRELPLAAIETLLNEPTISQRLSTQLDESASDLNVTEALSHFEIRTVAGSNGKRPRPDRPRSLPSRRPTVQRPPQRTLSDEFFEQLAEFYVYSVSNGERPLVAIEREAGVPRNTAARWVALARKHGFLATDTSITKMRKERNDLNQTKPSSRTSKQ